MKKKFALLLFTVFCRSLASHDLKEPLNPFDHAVTSAIIAQKKAAREAKQKREKETTVSIPEQHSINNVPNHTQDVLVYKKKCYPEWCGNFCFPLSFLLCFGLLGGAAVYCKATSSCLGFGYNSADNSTISNNGTLNFSPTNQQTRTSTNHPILYTPLKVLLNTRNINHPRRKHKRKSQFLKQPKR